MPNKGPKALPPRRWYWDGLAAIAIVAAVWFALSRQGVNRITDHDSSVTLQPAAAAVCPPTQRTGRPANFSNFPTLRRTSGKAKHCIRQVMHS